MNANNRTTRLDDAIHRATSGPHVSPKIISLSDITTHPDFQMRNKVDNALVQKYAKAISNGATFPPIKIALVDGQYILVDGWHRHAATARAHLNDIEAIITPMTHGEALQAAALANSAHGKPLSQTEKRKAFKAFIKGGGHRLPKRKIMSYRALAATLGGTNGHTTIRQWMAKDFPSIHKLMGGDSSGCGSAEPRAYLPKRSTRELMLDISNIAHLARLERDPYKRYDIIQALEGVLTDMKSLEHCSSKL